MLKTWRELRPLLPSKSGLGLLVLVGLSLIAGVLEAVVFILVVSVALAVAEGATTVSVAGQVEATPVQCLLLSGAAGAAMLLLHLHVARSGARLSAEALFGARKRLVTAFTRASWSRQEQDRVGALQESASSLATNTSALVVYFVNFCSSAAGLVALLLAAVVVDALVSATVLFFGGILFLALRPVSRWTRRSAKEYVTANSEFTQRLAEWGSLAMELRLFGTATQEAERMLKTSRQVSDAMARTRTVSRAGSMLYRDVAILFLVVAVGVLLLLPDIDLASVGAVVLLVVRSLSCAQTTNAAAQQVREYGPNVEALTERIASLTAAEEESGSRAVDSIPGVSLVNVGYMYDGGEAGLSGVSLELAKGEALGVLGPSGGGKSTLAQVLLRLRRPSAGRILVSGIPYEEIDDSSWNRLVAAVPQEPHLFAATVAENIAFLRPGIDRRLIAEAAEAANVLRDIESLPQGFDTMLGPRGAGLSGGQKQRIAIARALAGKPELLVLDEPTSALDIRSEQALQETIAGLRGSVTLVIIAHRIATLAVCDRVLAMRTGQVHYLGDLAGATSASGFDIVA